MDDLEFKLKLHSWNAQFRSKLAIFCQVWPWRAPLLCYCKLCASFHSHLWIQTGVTVRKRPIRVNICDFFCPIYVTLKLDRWPWRAIEHLFFATSSFAHHFIAIGEFKLELQSGNIQFRSKSVIFLSRLTMKFDKWPWTTIRLLLYLLEQRRQAMLQLHLSDQKFYCLLRCALY